MESRFEEFIREKKYLIGVSPATCEWYASSLRWLPGPSPDGPELKAVVMKMREHGLKSSSCNCHIRAINSYLHWSSAATGVKCSAACPHPKVPCLKEEQRILPTFSNSDIQKIVKWKPRGFFRTRAHVLMLLLADTGCRSGEATALRWRDVDLDNLLLTLHGKAATDRIVPCSLELRRHLYRWRQLNRWDLVFPTRQGGLMGRRNVLRGVKLLCQRLDIAAPERTVHAFRHTFAVNYLRRGGSVFHLQQMLGHSTLEMVRKYANLLTGDLQRVHEKISLLNPEPNQGQVAGRDPGRSW
jgi:integrase/recombinase XerD